MRTCENGSPEFVLSFKARLLRYARNDRLSVKFQKLLCNLFLAILFIPSLSTSALSYEIQITGNIPLADNLTGISINSNTGVAAAVSSDTKTLYIIDTNLYAVIKKIPLDMIPSCVTVDGGKNLAIVSSIDGILQFVDIESGGLIKNISTGKAIHSLAIDGKNNTLFIGNSNSLMVMDLETGNIIKETSMTNAIVAMDIDPYLGYLLMIMEGKGGIYLYDANTLD